MANSDNDQANFLFDKLNKELKNEVNNLFFEEPSKFRSLIEVIKVLGTTTNSIGGESNGEQNDPSLGSFQTRIPAYGILRKQRALVNRVVEDVVKFQHGSLNNSVDTMSDVLEGYGKCRDDVRSLRVSLHEIKTGVSSKRGVGLQADLRELWLRNKQLEHELRILCDVNTIREAPGVIEKLAQHKRYLSAVCSLNRSLTSLFTEDLINVEALVGPRDALMELKGKLLDGLVTEFRRVMMGTLSGLDPQESSAMGGGVSWDGDWDGDDNGHEVGLTDDIEDDADGSGVGVGVGVEDREEDDPNHYQSQSHPYSQSLRERGDFNPDGERRCGSVATPPAQSMSDYWCEQPGKCVDAQEQFRNLVSDLRLKVVTGTTRMVGTTGSVSVSAHGIEGKEASVSLFLGFVRTVMSTGLNLMHRVLYVFGLLNKSKSSSSSSGSLTTQNIRSLHNLWTDVEEVCPPSPMLAALLYRDALQFSEHANSLLLSKGIIRSSNSVHSVSDQHQQQQLPIYTSKVLSTVHRFVESELLPTVQSQVNEQLREAVGTSSHFLSKSVLSGSTGTVDWETVAGILDSDNRSTPTGHIDNIHVEA
eukprot:gene6612-13388_t